MLKGDVLNKITRKANEEQDDKPAAEQVEKLDDKQGDHLDEELDEETTQAIAKYQTLIEELDERLNQFEVDKVERDKRAALENANYSDEQVEKYVDMVEGETVDEISESINELIEDIKPLNRPSYVEPSLNNGMSGMPAKVDGRQVGRKLVKNAKSNQNKRGRYYG